MSRHRIVRSMNYEDEFYDDDEEYSRSVEDSYCISPSTAAQFTWNREKNVNFAAYMGEGEVINEEDEGTEEDDSMSRHDSLSDSATSARLQLSDLEQAQLNSCLEEARNILGDSIPESLMADVIIKNQFNLDTAVNQLLCQQDAPKPQREPRQRRNRSQDDIDNVELDNLLAEIQGLESATDIDVFQQHGLRCTSNDFQVLEMNENETEDSSVVMLHKVPENKSILGAFTSPDRNSTGGSENLKEESLSKHLSESLSLKQNMESSSAKSAKSSAANVNIQCDSVDSPKHIPSQAAKAAADVPQGHTDSALSLSDLIKQARTEKSSKAQAVGSEQEKKNKDKGATTSLAALARQHKESSAASLKTASSEHHPAVSQKLQDGLVSLSALVAQHSAQKKSSSLANKNLPTSSGTHGSNISVQGEPKAQQVNADSSPTPVNMQPKSSLSDLAKAHTQSQKSVSLSELAKKHRQSNSPSSSLSLSEDPQSNKQSVSSLLKDLSLTEQESRLGSELEGRAGQGSDSSNIGTPSLSLSSCLKTVKKSNTTDSKKLQQHLQSKENIPIPGKAADSKVPSVIDSWVRESLPRVDSTLVSQASPLGLALCYMRRKRKMDSVSSDASRSIKYPRFVCGTQLSNRKLYLDIVQHKIKAFDFSIPSPDDIVRNKQKLAFTRSDKEFSV